MKAQNPNTISVFYVGKFKICTVTAEISWHVFSPKEEHLQDNLQKDVSKMFSSASEMSMFMKLEGSMTDHFSAFI